MLRNLCLLALLFGLAGAPPAAAEQSEESVPPVTAPVTVSTMIRNAGFPLSAEEAAYLDADEQATEQFLRAILTAELHAPTINDDYSRQIVLAELRRAIGLDPAGVGVAAPASLAELDRLAHARRAAMRQTAQRWLDALSASDPNWIVSGLDSYGAARQAEADWYNVMRQIFTSRPPSGPMP